jgi:hypothetical protein
MTLDVVAGRLAVCRLDAAAPVPPWALGAAPPASITRTAGELSIVCPQEAVPEGITRRDGWRALAVRGPLDFALTGVLAGLAGPLAEAEVPIFALSTHDTDLVLVAEDDLGRAVAALRDAGHEVAA